MESIEYIAIGSRGIVKNNLNVYIGVVAHRYQAKVAPGKLQKKSSLLI
ncbi:hypothetical protein [Bacillus mycoides]|nr:hypothetical protein [Bacillus mycoides]MBJ7998085.1 hypothetical protein [Bacillus cereus]MED1405613.1 hypothetical protein [Bacillus mycoides]QWI93400.1 hypothetical protein J5V73_15785 [Bacillus mycoides]UNJ93767.1 hypothetical protein MN093_25530 [Bacillus mycoides]